jgi:oxygen-independent coproporphyrinogen-3 oxidase
VPGAPPDGQPVPASGALPDEAQRRVGSSPFSLYIHVPFCATRCGYCDFNTYTADEIGGAAQGRYADLAISEIKLARRVLGQAELPVQTVFFGGGTPTLLAPAALAAILGAVDGEFGLAPGAEVTTEANPESVDQGSLAELRRAGFTRVSFGMQSAVPHVLATLDRVHTPDRPARAAKWARAEGFGQVSLDLIYGTPGESDADWRRSVEVALAAEPTHISAYALIVETGTRLAAQIRRGKLAAPDDDAMADRYLAADNLLGGAGLRWYEISNWAPDQAARCRHNLAYWTGADWWGIGPGAHSHVGGTRWWNVRHPRDYAARLTAGESPAQAREMLTEAEKRTEQIMLTTRLADGCPAAVLPERGRAAAVQAVTDGLAEPEAWADGRVVLTRRGRLLADAVIRDLTG